MHYFRILVGLRGCYSDSSENEIYACKDSGALCETIAERLAWHSETGEELDPTIDPCTPEQCAAIFASLTGPRPPSLPYCAASWQGGQMGVMVSHESESVYAESQLQESDSFTADDSATVYFKAPQILARWLEYGREGIEGDGDTAESECESYVREMQSEYEIPDSALHKVHSVSTESEFGFERLYAFTMPNGLTYAGAACVLAYIPSLPN